MDIAGQPALVTGAGSGLGAATAERLARAGARVALLDLDPDAAAVVAERIGGLALAADVADEASASAAIAAAADAHGPARVLVNCAGIGLARRVLGRRGATPLADFERVIRVNLTGSYNMLRLVTAGMAKLEPLAGGERGVVVSTASIAAFDGQLGQAAYAASKGGVAAMTLPIAREMAGHGIRVNAIAPGLFATPLLAVLPATVRQALGASIPFPARLGLPEEFAALVAHIVENSYLNGEVIRLDGALRLPPR